MHLTPSLWEGLGRGAATAKRNANYLCARAFSPRGMMQSFDRFHLVE